MAGTSQSGAQSGRPKPVIQDGPAEEILSGPPAAGYGRVRVITNGRFVEVKQEKRWLAVRLLWSNPAGRFGSCAGARGQQSMDCCAPHTSTSRPDDRYVQFSGQPQQSDDRLWTAMSCHTLRPFRRQPSEKAVFQHEDIETAETRRRQGPGPGWRKVNRVPLSRAGRPACRWHSA